MDASHAGDGDSFWRVDGPGGGVFVESRDQNGGAAREAAVRERFGGGEISGVAFEGGTGALSGVEVASGSCAGEAADARVWVDAGVRYEGRIGGGATGMRSGAVVLAGGESGRSGVAGGVAGIHVALQHVGGGTGEGGDYGGDDSHVDWD